MGTLFDTLTSFAIPIFHFLPFVVWLAAAKCLFADGQVVLMVVLQCRRLPVGCARCAARPADGAALFGVLRHVKP